MDSLTFRRRQVADRQGGRVKPMDRKQRGETGGPEREGPWFVSLFEATADRDSTGF